MPSLGRPNPHLRLTAAILVAVLAALAGGFAADGADPRTRRAEFQSALRFVIERDDAGTAARTDARALHANAFDAHAARAATVASDRSGVRAEHSLRRTASAARAARLKTTALPPPLA
ncbi:MAG: hypothetical protein GC172_00940 [Phycisphaera sp.]|nr:hypothetical protein [Phycisphaera sp.]